jgi:hypothetical protein
VGKMFKKNCIKNVPKFEKLDNDVPPPQKLYRTKLEEIITT